MTAIEYYLKEIDPSAPKTIEERYNDALERYEDAAERCEVRWCKTNILESDRAWRKLEKLRPEYFAWVDTL